MAEVIDPDGRVDQDQDGCPVRRRGAAISAGWVPRSRARRLALWRSMSAANGTEPPSVWLFTRSWNFFSSFTFDVRSPIRG